MKKKTTYILELNIYNKNNNSKMNDLNELIQITKDEYLKLVSSQIVLNCLKNSLRVGFISSFFIGAVFPNTFPPILFYLPKYKNIISNIQRLY